jgi:hypothetical protein
MANTVIQLKWSEVTAAPSTLNVAEPAYSNTSGKLYIGDAASQPILIGGKYYVDLIDAATSANTGNTIVKRDTDGNFSASVIRAALYGNANSATQLETARWFNFSGDVDATAVSFDGTANADFTLELTNTGVSAGNYGGTTQIPVFNVDVDGRITSAANVNIATTLNIQGDSGTDGIALLTDTIDFEGGDGITTAVFSGNNTVKIEVDNTVLRNGGQQSITGDLAITGNLVVMGDEIIQDVTTIRSQDALIELSANNAADAIDIGFFGSYVNGGTKYTGFFRDASDSGRYKLLTGGTEAPTAANTVNTQAFSTATLVANITGGTVSGLTSPIAIADGGTGASSFTANELTIYNGSSLVSLANTGISAGTYGSADRTQIVQVDNYGRIVALTNTTISIDATQIDSGLVEIARGGTNNDTYTTGAILQFNGTSIGSLANTGTAGTYGAENYIPVVTTDVYGRVSGVSNTAINNLSTDVLTSGTLGVARGGTGASTFTTKGVIVSDTSSGTGALSALTSSTEGHVLQINASGVPTFAHLNGGFF